MGYYDWTCPYCSRNATLGYVNLRHESVVLTEDNVYGTCVLNVSFKVCPNEKCKKFTLTATLSTAEKTNGNWHSKKHLFAWDLLPRSKAQTFPSYVPKAVVEDYDEACLIKDLSPKASATLSRRCLQGILRDYWNVKPGRLIDEIAELETKIDPLTWQAIEAVRKVGNIGAHMEKDINIIVDVEPNEAELLIGLIEYLINDWYVARHNKQQHLQSIVALAAQKDAAKKLTAATP